ncbi:hypothetical protein ACEUZ9_000070 [Paracoccus litorisediminis]|uniref:hypothetical protein n=1 Tax=Paracoccus litorisediminis TaxID=2006130 RepID=UPI003731CCA8
MAQEPDLVISAGFSDAQLVKDSNRILAEYRRKGEEFQKAFVDAQGKVTDTQALRAHQRRMDNLKKAYDPAYRAAAKYRDEVQRLNEAVKGGALTQAQYEKSILRATRTAEQAGESIKRAGQQGGTGWQNFGFQVGDFATQVGAGTSAAQALGQQLPQLLGGFGTFGALAGAAAAIMIPLGTYLYKAAGNADSLDASLEKVSETTKLYTAAVEAAAIPIDELRARHGELADEIERANGLQLAFASAASTASIQGVGRSLAQQFGGVSGRAVQADGAGGLSTLNRGLGVTTELERAIKRVAKEYKISEEAARSFVNQIVALEKATGPEDQAKALEAMMQALVDGAGTLDAAVKSFGGEGGIWQQLNVAFEAATERAKSKSAQANQELLQDYDSTTQNLRSLATQRERAEKALTESVAAGNAEQVAAYERVIKAIDREIAKTRELARESDAAFQGMARAYQQYADSRIAGAKWAQSAEGFEAQYVADRARGAGSADEELVRAVTALAEKMGIAAEDLLAVMSFETAGKLRPDVIGPTTSQGQHFGLIQFGDKGAGPRYGVTPDSSITEQVIAAGRYLQDAGVKAGDSLANIYAAVLSGDARKVNASDLAAGGVVGNVTEATSGDQFAPHKARATGLLAAYGGIAAQAKKDQQDVTEKLKDEVKERERIAKQVKAYGEDLAKNLLTEQQQAALAKQQAEQIAAIKASGMSAQQQASAIAAVNGEIEKQKTIFALLEEAKRRQVDLDAKLVNGTMTYRQAIEALGEQKKQQIVTTEELAQAEERAGQKIDFAAQMQKSFEEGLIDSIVAGESFADVLGNIAQMIAKAMLQAALFNQGPWATGSGSGLLGGLTDVIFGGFRAAGGDVAAGRAYVVGEKGPEVIVPKSPGTVIPNHELGGGGLTASFAPSIHLNPGVTQADLAMAMAAARREYEQKFLPMLRKNLPKHNERYA